MSSEDASAPPSASSARERASGSELTTSAPDWTPTSWRAHPAEQQPHYDDAREVEAVLARIRTRPPLVVSAEVLRLRQHVARAAAGQTFLLQGGDCAERFAECRPDTIVRKIKILLQMSLVIAEATKKPVVRVARMAGQYAKPRSSPWETIGGRELPAYHGDSINDPEPTPEKRRPDPQRLELAYFHSALTLNFARALLDGGLADLRRAEHWDLAFLGDSPHRGRYQQLANRIRSAIDMVGGLGALREDAVDAMELFTAHEGLVLPLEEALTMRPPGHARWFNLGAHFLWIGERTRQLEGAHVEYFRGIANPIGIKLGPSTTTDELLRLIDRLDPHDEPGKLVLISRCGAEQVGRALPPLVRAIKRSGRRVQWTVDPMHGNGTRTASGVKTRRYDAILAELRDAFAIHAAEGSILSGAHFELTGDDVTECIGGAQGLDEAALERRYLTGCDPRLNHAQSLEMAFQIADLARGDHHGSG